MDPQEKSSGHNFNFARHLLNSLYKLNVKYLHAHSCIYMRLYDLFSRVPVHHYKAFIISSCGLNQPRAVNGRTTHETGIVQIICIFGVYHVLSLFASLFRHIPVLPGYE